MLCSAYETISKYDLISDGDRIVVGVSGGADSMALLDLLYDISRQKNIYLCVVHVNHCLRGEDADNDQQYVEDFCREKGILCRSFRFDVADIASKEHLTSEEAGRKVRYSAFEAVAEELSANKVATAHHMNDNCETLLFNILRGSGLTGLCGIRPMRGKYIRPLIKTSRDEIEAYLTEKNIHWCTDKTNSELLYTRNKIRLELLPYIKKRFNPSVEHALQRLCELCSDDNDFIDAEAKRILSECIVVSDDKSIVLDRAHFKSQHISVKRRIIRCVLERLSVPLKDVHMVHIDNCIRMLCESESGATTSVGNCRVCIEQRGVCFTVTDECGDFEYSVRVGSTVNITEADVKVRVTEVKSRGAATKNTVYVSVDEDVDTVTVRNRRNGDRIRPFGMNGVKKLKDLFIDKKIPLSQRDKIPLFAHNNKIMWVGGCCISEDCRITSATNRILMLEIISDKE